MFEGFFSEFVWRVPVDGFTWGERPITWVGRESVPALVLNRVGFHERKYNPLVEFPHLYLEFASMDPTPEKVLEFAGKYGALGSYARYYAADSKRGMVEPHGSWRGNVEWLNFLINLWDAAETGDRDRLGRWVSWDRRRPVYHLPEISVPCPCLDRSPSRAQIQIGLSSAAREAGPRRFFDPAFRGTRFDGRRFASLAARSRLEHGDKIGAARLLVMSAVNLVLQDARFGLTWDRQRARPVLQGAPDSLLGAMYLQFAIAIDGGRQHRQCSQCRKWFVVKPGVSRSDRLTCSDACRVRMSRERRERALKLYSEGGSVSQIATETGSTPAKIKEWIAQSKGE